MEEIETSSESESLDSLRPTMSVCMIYLTETLNKEALSEALAPIDSLQSQNGAILTQKKSEQYKGMNSLIIAVHLKEGASNTGTFKVLGDKIHVSGLRTLEQVQSHGEAFLEILKEHGILGEGVAIDSIRRIITNANYKVPNPPESFTIAKHIRETLKGNPKVRHSPEGEPLVYWLPVDNTRSSPTRTFYITLSEEVIGEEEVLLRKHNEVSYMFRINNKTGEGSVTQSCPSWEYSELARGLFLETVDKISKIA